jgi:PAT family beta-lactamase induction signal transducer AmpG
MTANLTQKTGLWWIPSLAFLGAIPFIIAQQLSSVLYKNLGVSNSDITFYTSLLYLPWVVKPLWSPLIDIFKTKRAWIIALQMAIGAGLAALSLSLHTPYFFAISLLVFWFIAFASASHDIAADGFYMLALNSSEQAVFVGVRSLFFRIANIVGGGIPVIFVGRLTQHNQDITQSWSIVLMVISAIFIVITLYHAAILPHPTSDQSSLAASERKLTTQEVLAEFAATFREFFQKKEILFAILFILLFRLGEAQALKVVSLFMLDPRAKGGLGLSNQEFGVVYSIVGIAFLTIGGLLGGWLISRHGLKRMLWPMVLTMHLPNLAFVFLALAQPENLTVIATALAIEQFGYGFGFTAFLMIMMMIADGPKKTSHYALCTGFMAAGMMIPGAFSGDLSQYLGYGNFFIWVCLCTVPGLILTAFLKIESDFGRKVSGA